MAIYLVSSCVKQSGKTTLATNLTEKLSRQGRTMLLDIDAKSSAYAWAQQASRDFDSEHLIFDPEDAEFFRQRLTHLKKYYQFIVIDADGTDSHALRSIMMMADKLIVPISQLEDQHMLNEMILLAIAVKQFNPELQIYIVMNRQMYSTAQAELSKAKQLLHHLPVHFINSMLYEEEEFQTALVEGESIWQKNAEAALAFDRMVLELQA